MKEKVAEMPSNLTEYAEPVMSNYDRLIDEDIAALLKNEPLFSRYPGWNFNGKVWWEDNRWHCAVWQYGSHVNTISEDTLEEIMHSVCEMYGYE